MTTPNDEMTTPNDEMTTPNDGMTTPNDGMTTSNDEMTASNDEMTRPSTVSTPPTTMTPHSTPVKDFTNTDTPNVILTQAISSQVSILSFIYLNLTLVYIFTTYLIRIIYLIILNNIFNANNSLVLNMSNIIVKFMQFKVNYYI